ncbi:MAG: phosphonate C-P lyase system protein PhnH [Deltaproteobacteria bacterium]|nr:phosphonate C-P lyase system protein PhnH [Deltaproteobacteria bacterium]
MARSRAIQWLPVTKEDPAPGTFQAVLIALEHPGAIVRLPKPDSIPWPLNSASAALLAVWVNPETPVWTDLGWDSDPSAWLQQTCACSLVTEPCMARVAFIAESFRIPSLGQFFLGEDDRPETSTTLILQVPGFSMPNRRSRNVSGGGRSLQARPTGLPLRFWSDWEDQKRYLPLGMDVFFTCADTMAALPRGMQLT